MSEQLHQPFLRTGYIYIFKDIDKCVICGNTLEVDFPNDFPDSWKFCCSCLNWANYLINGNGIAKNWLEYEARVGIKNTIILKIWEKITLVENEGKK